MFTLTIFGFGPENGSTKGTLGMKFEPEHLAFGGVGPGNLMTFIIGRGSSTHHADSDGMQHLIF